MRTELQTALGQLKKHGSIEHFEGYIRSLPQGMVFNMPSNACVNFGSSNKQRMPRKKKKALKMQKVLRKHP